jgi:hypothetical protein
MVVLVLEYTFVNPLIQAPLVKVVSVELPILILRSVKVPPAGLLFPAFT